MQTNLIQSFLEKEEGKVAEEILRSCVHCGFCNATCPSYQVLGDELDGPRGRIYLMKQMFEGHDVTEKTRVHLDRCLSCRACETTCPSGVEYHKLLDIGKAHINDTVPGASGDSFKRRSLAWFLGQRRFFALLLSMGRLARPLLPSSLRASVPERRNPDIRAVKLSKPEKARPLRSLFVMQGCVQDAISPEINAAAKVVFEALGFEWRALPRSCCGAMDFHLDQQKKARQKIEHNMAHWLSAFDEVNQPVLLNLASGCTAFLKDYEALFPGAPEKQARARTVVESVFDPIELLEDLVEPLSRALSESQEVKAGEPIAFQSPCSLQHGQQLSGRVEALLKNLGLNVVSPEDAHLCCGSAGAYSLMQPEISGELKRRKLQSLRSTGATLVLSANIGCQTHLSAGSEFVVKHWLVMLAEMLTEARSV